MPQRDIIVNGTNDATYVVNGTADMNIYFPANNNTYTLAAQGEIPSGLSAGTQSGSTGTFIFSNANNVTFGMAGSATITASVTVASTQGSINFSGGTTSNNLSAITFSNSNGISFGLNGSTMTGSVATSLTNINLSAGTTSNNLSAFVFSNSNNVSFGLNGSTVTATITVPAQTNQTVGLYGLGNTTQNSSTTLDARSISLNGLGMVTVGYSNGSVQISATQSKQDISFYALGNTTQNSSSVINASVVSLNGLGIITAGYSNGSIQLSATQSNQAFSAAGGSSAFQTLSFGDTNGVSFTNTNGSLGIASVKLSMYGVSNTTQSSSGTANHTALSFAGAGVVSVGVTNGSVVISAPTAAASPVGVSAGTTSNTMGTINFADSNGVSFGLNGSTVTASHNGITSQTNQNISLYALGNTTQNSSTLLNASNLSLNGLGAATVGYSNGSIQISAPVQTNQTLGFYGLNNTTQNSSTTLDARTISFNVTGPGLSIGYSNGSIVLSRDPHQSYYMNYPIYQGTTAFTLGASSVYVQPFVLPTAISASFIRIANSFAFGSTTGGTTANTSLTLNNSQSIWVNIYSKGTGANSRSLQYVTGGSVSMVFQVRAEIGAASNNQTVSHNFTYPNESGAAQGNFATNYNVNSGSYNISTTHLTSFNGFRWLDVPFAASLAEGAYWMGIGQSTATATTGGVAAMTNVTARNTFVAVSQISTNIAVMGQSSNMSTSPWQNGLGYWSTNTNGTTSSSMSLAGISTVANQPILPFQFIREA
jgi:hypothetical protein